MNISIRDAKIEDAHVIAEAEREIAKEPGFFCSQPSELSDENVINTISAFLRDKTGVHLVADYESAQKLYIHLRYVPDRMRVTYKSQIVLPGDSYPVDDDLLIWLKKDLS